MTSESGESESREPQSSGTTGRQREGDSDTPTDTDTGDDAGDETTESAADEGTAETNDGYYFLPDEPIREADNLEFGHEQYVETIVEIVQEVSPPWQIGLFGRWGTGKSSILQAVEEKLTESETDIEFVEFDAWKHSEESIRTEFLLSLNRALGESEGGPLDDNDGEVIDSKRIKEKLMDVSKQEESSKLPFKKTSANRRPYCVLQSSLVRVSYIGLHRVLDQYDNGVHPTTNSGRTSADDSRGDTHH